MNDRNYWNLYEPVEMPLYKILIENFQFHIEMEFSWELA